MSRLNFFNILIIVFFSFLINWYSANMGVLPIDTFGFFDTGYIILKGQLPVRDYWAYTGITVDYFQSFFFFFSGFNNLSFSLKVNFLVFSIPCSHFFLL